MASMIIRTIREHGFRKWYERQLLRSHVHLVLLLACGVGALGALEVFSETQGGNRVLVVVALLASIGIGAWAGRRYLFHLMQAEVVASQAVCKACRTYARWHIEAEDPAEETFSVCCAKCGHRWRIAC